MFCIYKNQRKSVQRQPMKMIIDNSYSIDVVVIELFILFNILNLPKGNLILNKSQVNYQIYSFHKGNALIIKSTATVQSCIVQYYKQENEKIGKSWPCSLFVQATRRNVTIVRPKVQDRPSVCGEFSSSQLNAMESRQVRPNFGKLHRAT